MSNISARIIGVGETAYVRGTEDNVLGQIVDASLAACRDASVEPSSIDGVVLGSLQGPSSADLINSLGLQNCKYHSYVRMGGASAVAAVHHAAMAVSLGVASRVLVAFGVNGFSRSTRLNAQDQELRGAVSVPGSDIRENLEFPLGIHVPMQWYSFHANRWLHEYRIDTEALAEVAISTRRHANLNARAYMNNRALSRDQYFSSSYIVQPFRLYDICLETDGAAAVIVSAPSVGTYTTNGVTILSGAEGSPDWPDDLLGRKNIMTMGISKAAERAFDGAGISPSELDFAQIYDCFSFIVLRQLEEIGICERGDSDDFVLEGRIRLGGDLPVNTHGGLLSEAHVLGMNHLVEAVRQLRGECGARQVLDAKLGVVTGYGDFGEGSILVLGK